MKTILLTGAFPYTTDQLAQLKSLGCTAVYMQQESDQIPCSPSEVNGVVCNGLFLHHPITVFSSLEFIQLTSAGYDRIPMDAVSERGIKICNARGVYSIPMAEWAMARILEHFKHLQIFVDLQRERDWTKDRALREVSGSNAAIIGAGNIGQEVAKRLSAFGVSVDGYDIMLGERAFFDSVYHVDDLRSQISRYDIIILTAPHTPETHHMVNSELMGAMKKGAMLVNIARGGLVDTNAFVDVLKKRSDLFAALDVFEEEPLPPDHPLWQLSNAALSPHNSFVSDRNNERLFSVIFNNLKNYLSV